MWTMKMIQGVGNLRHDVRTNQKYISRDRISKPKATHHSILLVLNHLHCDLRQEIIVQQMCWKVRLDGQTLGQELLAKVLTSLLTHQDASAVLVLKRATSLAHHLQNIHYRVVDVPMFFSLIELNAHDDDHMAGHR